MDHPAEVTTAADRGGIIAELRFGGFKVENCCNKIIRIKNNGMCVAWQRITNYILKRF